MLVPLGILHCLNADVYRVNNVPGAIVSFFQSACTTSMWGTRHDTRRDSIITITADQVFVFLVLQYVYTHLLVLSALLYDKLLMFCEHWHAPGPASG